MKRNFPVCLAVGTFLTLFFTLSGILSLFWVPGNTGTLDIASRLHPPDSNHWLGTDHLGRDVLSMIMKGAPASIAVSLIATGTGLVAGVPLGLFAAARGGLSDDILMRTGDVVFAFPAVIIAILMTSVTGPGMLNAALAIGLFNIPVFARLSRSAALPLWKSGFVTSAKAMGRNSLAISAEHIMPNMLHILAIQATIQFSMGILAESGLSYIGLGVQPPAASWGRMLAESQATPGIAPWLALAPGLSIFLFVLGINLLGDGLRRKLDPQQEAWL